MDKIRSKQIYLALLAILGSVIQLVVSSACQQTTEELQLGASSIVPSVTVDAGVTTVGGEPVSGVVSYPPAPEKMSFRLSDAGGKYNRTWSSVADYPVSEPLRYGTYMAEAFSGTEVHEGFDSPYFYGSTSFTLSGGQPQNVSVVCRLFNAVFKLYYSDRFKSRFSDASVMLHASGGGFFDYPVSEDRYCFLSPGDVSLYMKLPRAAAAFVEFLAVRIPDARSTTLYPVSVDLQSGADGVDEIVISFDPSLSTDDVIIRLTPELLASAAPVMTPVGFSAGEPVSLTEGSVPDSNIAVDVQGSVSSLVMTTQAESLISQGWPIEIDLAAADAAELSRLESMGLVLKRDRSGISGVDLTSALRHLRATDAAPSFSFVAAGPSGLCSGPLVLDVNVAPVDLAVVEVSDILIGVNVGQMKLLANGDGLKDNLELEVFSEQLQSWLKAEIAEIEEMTSRRGEWLVRFKIPSMNQESVDFRVRYAGDEKVSLTLRMVSPEFSIEVDAFARLAVVRIAAQQSEMLDIITSLADIYVNGAKTLLVSRDIREGYIVVGGLEPHTAYVLKATLFDESSAEGHFTNEVKIETERDRQVPNGGFEDIKEGIKYTNLPAGGRYSQNIVDIFNQQNYASYDLYIPKNWANVNAKTFSGMARNRNTWYMQPTTFTVTDAVEQSYAVMIQSSAWDLDGPQIPDYRQTSTPYVGYSKNIPVIAHRAAGRLFLGEYGFDPVTGAEVFSEGIAFGSRPNSLNGYYKFIPAVNAQSDCGKVVVEVLGSLNGSEIVLAHSELLLPAATGYKAFSVPVTYEKFGVKATKMKIMIASSAFTGSIDEESSHVVTFSDPVTSTSLGGKLWIDNLTFAY